MVGLKLFFVYKIGMIYKKIPSVKTIITFLINSYISKGAWSVKSVRSPSMFANPTSSFWGGEMGMRRKIR